MSMTNQQGAPEALRLADALQAVEEGWSVADECCAELRRLHAENERLAALVEAQQPAAHVQNHAEIEHVAGDVSKNGTGSNMAQQPAPSAAAFDEHGFRDWVLRNLPKGSIIGNGEWWADHLTSWAKRFVKAAPQHSPTPQADSQPAPVLPESLTLAVDRWFSENTGLGGCSDKDVSELAELFYGAAHAGGRESVDDALAIVESFGPGIGGLNDTYARQILLAEEVKRLRAASAPADSVTAPAGGGVVGWLPVHFNGHGFYGGPLKTEAEANQYIAQVHQSNDSVTLIARPFAWATATSTTSVRAEALRLAEALDLYAAGDEHQRDIEDAAAELRRLHATQPAQAADSVLAPALSKGEFKQFLTDVHTAAGLVSHGKRCKALGERLGNAVMRLLAAATAPAGGVVARVLLDSAGKPMLRPQLLGEEFLADPEAFDAMYPHRAPHRIADLYATPPAKSADSVLEDAARWQELRAQHEDYEAERCCVFAPNDMLECLVPVGSLPGELDAFIDAEIAARKQGGE